MLAFPVFAAAVASCSVSGGAGLPTGAGGATTASPVPTPIQADAQFVALGDSITYGMYADNYASEGYAALFASDIAGNLTNLSIPGETSTGIISDEVAKIPRDAQVITLFIGTNDELTTIENNESAADVEARYSANMARIATMLRLTFPLSRIFVANLPNLANFPEWADAGASIRTAMSQMNGIMNATIDGLNFPVVDLRCDPQTYNPANLYQNGLGYGYVHPNTQGHVFYAADFFATAQGTLHEVHGCPFINPI